MLAVPFISDVVMGKEVGRVFWMGQCYVAYVNYVKCNVELNIEHVAQPLE